MFGVIRGRIWKLNYKGRDSSAGARAVPAVEGGGGGGTVGGSNGEQLQKLRVKGWLGRLLPIEFVTLKEVPENRMFFSYPPAGGSVADDRFSDSQLRGGLRRKPGIKTALTFRPIPGNEGLIFTTRSLLPKKFRNGEGFKLSLLYLF